MDIGRSAGVALGLDLSVSDLRRYSWGLGRFMRRGAVGAPRGPKGLLHQSSFGLLLHIQVCARRVRSSGVQSPCPAAVMDVMPLAWRKRSDEFLCSWWDAGAWGGLLSGSLDGAMAGWRHFWLAP